MKTVSFPRLVGTVVLSVAALFGFAAQAQSGYPNEPIRLVVPFPAGGATDIFARAVSQKLGERHATPVVVDNKPGAGGAIGPDIVAKAVPGDPQGQVSGGPTGSGLPFPSIDSQKSQALAGNRECCR